MENKEGPKILTITELSEFIKLKLPNNKIRVIGEISQTTIRGGHL
jgi:exonuclease VII large subunit